MTSSIRFGACSAQFRAGHATPFRAGHAMSLALVLLAVLLVPAVALAGAQPNTTANHGHDPTIVQVTAGSVEFTPSVSFTHQNFKREGYGNVEHFTQLDMRPTVGFCLTDHFEVTTGLLARHISQNGTNDTA